MAPQEVPGSLPARIGRYRIVAPIGRGGMGIVYRAVDEVLDREVAVKTLSAAAPFDEESRRRFLTEARAAARLQHPNIVTIYELGEEEGVPFIAMELLSGVDLETVMRSPRKLLLAETLEVLIQACRALDFAHERGVVHRDVKPSNIRLMDDGTAKVMDFGIAKLGAGPATNPGMIIGTLRYMSPEQVSGAKVDGRSDIFSLGTILYELLTGRPPFEGEGPAATLYSILHSTPEPFDLSGLGTSGERLGAILERALAKSPQERYARASLLADDLKEVLDRAVPPGSTPLAEREAVSTAEQLVERATALQAARHVEEPSAASPRSVPLHTALRKVLRALTSRASGHSPTPGPRAVAAPAGASGVKPLAEYTSLTRVIARPQERSGEGAPGTISRAALSLPSERPHVFLCYRREDAADISGRIADHLVRRLGPRSLFRDVDSVPLGANFKTYLETVVGGCFLEIVVIGRGWLPATDESGHRRLDDPSDWVRIEIEAALKRDIPVVPLLVHGAAMPRPEQLPESLRELAYLQGAAVRSDPDFHADMKRLVSALSKFLPTRTRGPAPTVSRPKP